MKLIISFILMLSTSGAWSTTLIYDAQKQGIELTERDKEILEIGKISTARYVAGGILGIYPIGLGIGHAIQGRWSQDGKVFTYGGLGSLAVVLIGSLGCLDGDVWICSNLDSALIISGALSFIGFRIWEIVDVWAAPPSINRKHQELQDYIEKRHKSSTSASLDLVPLVQQGPGLALRLTF